MLTWSILSVGLMISYYYGQCGIACVIYYRRYLFKSVKNFFFVGAAPAHRWPHAGLPVRALAHGHEPRRLHRSARSRGWA